MDIPFLIPLTVVLTASATGVMTYPVSTNEKLNIHEIRQKSTGAFNITGITDSRGRSYTSATPSVAVDSDFIADNPSPNIALFKLPIPLFVDGSMSINIQVQDTSGAGNTIEILLVGILTYG